ncbi:MAG: CRISPR system precrRNA processing endoribonuclease RAMP protein Cas6 [Agathobacter sp.]|nr:CRISPR system precrRNA processing endoribonuclease RAMP protein Cas6 [Agathobacter sp.]
MEFNIRDALDVRYIKLHFTLLFPEDCLLPVSKTSAIRGGMGEMLLRANCIRDRKCEKCDFYNECIVQRTMYSQFDNKPDFITTGDSVGYVVECENYQEIFEAGDTLEFNLILFGKTIVYFNQYLQALFALGQNGLGKNYAKFVIAQVSNTKGQPILDGNDVYMKYYQVETLSAYVDYRLNQVDQEGIPNKIVFYTPLTQKYKGEFLKAFDMDAITKSIQRRLYMLNCFEGKDLASFYEAEFIIPKIMEQQVRDIHVKRYSSRQDAKMTLKGIKGEILLDAIPKELLELYLAGEVIHIGKNTSFGFGRYKLIKK